MIARVQEVVRYGGHNLSANGSVTLTLNASYSELVKTIQTMQMLNNDGSIKAKLPGKKPMKLGMFRINHIDVFDDGTSRIKFKGISDYIEMDNLNSLPKKDEEVPDFKVLYEADIEEEDEESEVEEDGSDNDEEAA